MPSYWEQRAIDSIGRMESAVNGAVPELVKSFESARRDLNDTVFKFYARYAANNKIALDEAQKALSLSELRDFRGDLKEFERLAKDSIGTFNLEVDNLSVKARVTRYEALLAQCDGVLQKLYQEQKKQAEGTATNVYTSEYYHRLFDIEKYTGFKFKYSQLADSAIKKVIEQPVYGMDISEHLWRQDIDTGFKIRQTLNQMFVTGKPPQDFADKLQKTIGAVRVDKDGKVTGTGKKYEAYRLLYNESSHVTGQANLQAYKDDGIDEYEIVAALDKATCSICAPLDGKVYNRKDAVVGVNYPPFHVNCRCVAAPYIDAASGIDGERISRDPVTGKSVPTTAQTYDEWKAQQDKKYGAGTEEYRQIQDSGLRHVPPLDTFQIQRYNNSPEYKNLMQRYANIQESGAWSAVEFNPQTSKSHFEKHGSNVDANNTSEYKAKALKFVNETPNKEMVVDSDGVRRFYSQETNEFASVYPDGTISTYYKPSQGVKYWGKQVKKYGSKEK